MRLPPFKIEEFFERHEFKASYLLCCSDCESFSVEELLHFEPEVWQSFGKHWLGYTETHGSPELRNEIVGLYRQISAENVLVHSGGEEGIFVFMNAVLTKGDHVIIHYPCYQSLREVPRAIGCEVTKWVTREEDGWELDIDFLEQNIRENTRAIIINCPHNPTGYLMSHEKFSQVIALARQHNLIIFSDEVYRFLEYDPADLLPPACEIYENAVSLGVMSKSFGLPGLRIGWVATHNKQIIEKMAAFKNYLTICNSAPSEFLACVAIRNRERIITRNLAIIRQNLNLLNDFFSRYRNLINWQPPKAGPIAFPSINLQQGAEAFCMSLLDSKDVLLLPSSIYSFGDRNFRIGFGRKNLPECLQRLEEFFVESGSNQKDKS